MATPAGVLNSGGGFGERLFARAVAFEEIPLIDFAAMAQSDPAARLRVARAIRQACETAGFFYICNHGIPDEDIARIFELGRRFFALPLADKLILDSRKHPQFEGYTPMLAENTDPANRGDLHESFDMVSQFGQGAAAAATADAVATPAAAVAPAPARDVNAWPDALPEFKTQLRLYWGEVYQVGRRLFEAVALSLGLPEEFFHPYLTRPTAMLRLNYYPPQPATGDATQIGIGSHTDYECFTILAQQPGITALQVWNGREWIHAPPIPGTFIVNIADQMQRWTNDVFSSTRHRAINPAGMPRMSIPFFLGVNYETVISPLPSCVSAANPSKYPPVIAGEYVTQRLNETYGLATRRASEDAGA